MQAEKLPATGRMAATIAHEINNPLEAIMNLLYLIRPTISGDEGRAYLASAESELQRVSHIAKQTLGYYREDASAIPISLNDIVQYAVTIYEPRCQPSGIKILQSLTSERKVLLRRGEMLQVISNLLANSIYALSAGGTIEIVVKILKQNRKVLPLACVMTAKGSVQKFYRACSMRSLRLVRPAASCRAISALTRSS